MEQKIECSRHSMGVRVTIWIRISVIENSSSSNKCNQAWKKNWCIFSKPSERKQEWFSDTSATDEGRKWFWRGGKCMLDKGKVKEAIETLAKGQLEPYTLFSNAGTSEWVTWNSRKLEPSGTPHEDSSCSQLPCSHTRCRTICCSMWWGPDSCMIMVLEAISRCICRLSLEIESSPFSSSTASVGIRSVVYYHTAVCHTTQPKLAPGLYTCTSHRSLSPTLSASQNTQRVC